MEPNQQKTSVGEDVEKREPLCTVGGNVDWCSHCGKQCGVNLKKLKIELPYDLAILLLGMYPKKSKTLIQKAICSLMFTVALFTIAKYWKQPKCPSVNEWIKKLWYIYTVEFYAAERKKELIPFQQHGWNWRALCSEK